MNGFKIALLIVLALNLLATVWMVGKPREPITPGFAVWNVVWNVALAALVLLS